MEIGPTRSQVGVIVFSSRAYIEFGLTTYSSRASLSSAINNLRYTGGGTNTAAALTLLTNLGFTGARPVNEGVPRVAIVVTDGQSNDFSATLRAAQVLQQNASITTYAVGIGSADSRELNAIASTRNGRKLVYSISGFVSSEVRRLQEDLNQQACTGTHMVRNELKDIK